ncbi:unnamed protein product [Rhizoctonia solani]|uniref:Protein kinase domain-containing protein n=1 Tax=Rhizoctonia solani TaxID=456999 RepID=A0A8H2XHV5_9AGAM|nr:unnamed protein product [Rhizoctonia solani]
MMDEGWESSNRKRARPEQDEYRRDHLAYEHASHSLSREHIRRTPDHYSTDQSWDRRRVDHHWHAGRDQYQKDPPTDDLESSHDHSNRSIYTNHRPNGSSSSYHHNMSRPHRPRIDRETAPRHESREWIPRDIAKRGESWSSKPEEPRMDSSAGTGDRTWTASEGWTRENSKSANAARAHESRHSPPPRTHIPQAKVYNRSSHHISTSWRDTHDNEYASSRRHQNGGPSRVGEGWRERQVRHDRDSGHRFTERRDKNPAPQRRTIPNRKWTDRSAYSPPGESRGIGKRRHSSYSPSPSRKTERSRSPVRSTPRSPSRSKSRSPARSWHRTRTPSRSRSQSRSISSRSIDTRSRSRSRSPDGIIVLKSAKTSAEGMTISHPISGFEETGLPILHVNVLEGAASQRHPREAVSSRSKALENSPTAAQRLNGFNQQKPRPPLSPASFRTSNAMSRALAPETEPPAVEITAALTNGLHLSTGTIPTGPRSMTQVSQPQINSHPEPTVVPASKSLTTSPITLKVQPSKAPSKTVKMFFPGDDEDDDTPSGPDSGSRSANLIPPVKDRDSAAPLTQGPSKPEFVPAKASSAPRAPPTAPAAHLSPERKLNGSAVVSSPSKTTLNSIQQTPLAPGVARVIRDEASKTTTSTPLNSMPPPSAPNSSPTVPVNSGGTTTPNRTSTQRSPAFAPENKVPRTLPSSSNSIPRRPPKVPKTASEYQIICQVGEGTFGKVYKARSLANPEARVALKRIRMEGEKDGFPVTAMREIKLLQSLRHENVINLHEMMVSKGNVFMVFEYMDHDLTGVLSQTQFTFSPAHLKSLCAQMLSGLAYLHQKSVIHRDMKGSNILLNNHGELKLGDFGLARFYSKRRRSDYTNRVITLWYRPPELLLGATVYGPEVDMWSAGCIMLELFTTKPAFQGNDEIHQLDAIARVMGTPNVETWPGLTDMPWFELVKPAEPVKSHFRSIFNKYLSPAALDLAESLLAYDPNKRATAAQALQAPYFVSEDPPPEKPVGLATIEGEWHEYESKREREKLRKKRKVEGQQP